MWIFSDFCDRDECSEDFLGKCLRKEALKCNTPTCDSLRVSGLRVYEIRGYGGAKPIALPVSVHPKRANLALVRDPLHSHRPCPLNIPPECEQMR